MFDRYAYAAQLRASALSVHRNSVSVAVYGCMLIFKTGYQEYSMPEAQYKKKIPKSEILEFIVRDILRKRSVDSQKELAELINRKFAESSSGFRVSPVRARLAALETGAKILIRTKKGEAPKRCPGCGHRLDKSYIRNLKGRNTVLGMKCPRCGYEGRLGRWLPSRYGFSRL
jgi:predicted RNA-binding Zn-ribbon protein involved in translation (DUF1610 family)